jgi:hypothetical protein
MVLINLAQDIERWKALVSQGDEPSSMCTTGGPSGGAQLCAVGYVSKQLR